MFFRDLEISKYVKLSCSQAIGNFTSASITMIRSVCLLKAPVLSHPLPKAPAMARVVHKRADEQCSARSHPYEQTSS